MRATRCRIAVTVLAIASSWAAAGQAADDLGRCIEGQARERGFSGVVSVHQEGRTRDWAFGHRDAAGDVPMTTGLRFNLGSGGKMFTAVAVMQLVESRRIGLDDRLGRYVTGLTDAAGTVTVRQLLAHRSGLGNFFTPDNLPRLAEARTLDELKPLVARERPEFPPGTRFRYSNSGFLLLGLLVEAVTGTPFGDYLAAHVFAPANMSRTGLSPGDAATRAIGMTTMPLDGRRGEATPPRPAGPAAIPGNPAGGASSTAADMQRFFAALNGGKLLRGETLALMTRPWPPGPAAADEPAREYGLGFALGEHRGRRWFGHEGGTLGANTVLISLPAAATAIVVLANQDPPAAHAWFEPLMDWLWAPAPTARCGGSDPPPSAQER